MANPIEILRLVKMQHALFGLPLTLAAMIMASSGLPDGKKAFWIILAFFCARSLGMGLNRILDRHMDATNPRTAHRLMASGRLHTRAVLPWMLAFLLLFLLACSQLHPLAIRLFPFCILLLVVYPLCKRFTVLAHLVLGLTLALGPVGAWVGICGMPNAGILLFGLGVVFWVQGFDVLYALQDIEFDKAQGLYSIPARFGSARAKIFAAISHALTPICWAISGHLFSLGNIYQVGILLIFFVLVVEHWLVYKDPVRNIGLAFFRLNAGISLFILGLVLGVSL